MDENRGSYSASGVIPVAHLNATVRLLSSVIGYSYSDWDKDAIRYGALETDEETGPAFEYRIEGASALDLTFRRRQNARAVTITAHGGDAEIITRCQTVVNALRDFDPSQPFAGLQSVICEIFATNIYPGDDNLLFCDASHFRQCDEWLCDECAKAFSAFAGRKWEAVFTKSWTPLLNGWGLHLLTQEATFYFFPSYLAASLSPMGSGLLDDALRAYYPEYGFRIDQKTPLFEYGFSASQAQLVEIVKEITSMETRLFLNKDYS